MDGRMWNGNKFRRMWELIKHIEMKSKQVKVTLPNTYVPVLYCSSCKNKIYKHWADSEKPLITACKCDEGIVGSSSSNE